MHICAFVKSRLARAQGRAQSFVNRRLHQKAKRRSIQIVSFKPTNPMLGKSGEPERETDGGISQSEPFGFQHVATKLPGVTDDE